MIGYFPRLKIPVLLISNSTNIQQYSNVQLHSGTKASGGKRSMEGRSV